MLLMIACTDPATNSKRSVMTTTRTMERTGGEDGSRKTRRESGSRPRPRSFDTAGSDFGVTLSAIMSPLYPNYSHLH